VSTVGPALTVALARARRRPWRALAPALGIALAAAFIGAVWAEGTIAGQQAARVALSSLTPAQRAVTITWQGAATAAVDRPARAALSGLGLGPTTAATLLSPVRLNGHVVRPAAIAPLTSWITAGVRSPGPCRATTCPVLLDGTGIATGRVLAAPGVRLPIVGPAALHSSAPLGFVPGQAPGPPVLLGSDPAGLRRLAGLSSFYRTESWLAVLPVTGLHSWQLASLQRRLQRHQATLLSQAAGFTMAAPFAGLGSAQSQADGAPRRLLLVAGGGIAALALFLMLVVGGMRHESQDELERLRTIGARSHQVAAFVVADCALTCGAALVAGAVVAVAAAAVLAGAAHEPVGGILAHSLLTRRGLAVLAGGWLVTTLLIAALVTVPARARIADVAAIAAPAGGTVAAPPAAPRRACASWTPATIELRDVVRTRGHGRAQRTVLRGLTQCLAAGRMNAVAGASGSGKTTLLRLIAGLDRPDSGAILFDAHDLAADDAESLAALRRRRIGYLAQEPTPVGFLSAEENIVLALRTRGWDEPEARAQAARALARVGLTERARQRAGRLSAGEAQRLALARALASARGLLIVDEPTSRLDEANATMTAELLRAAAREDGQTVLCATHDERLLALADNVVDLTSAPSTPLRRATAAPSPG
jgi:putative ABC transport system ATP-binding protein